MELENKEFIAVLTINNKEKVSHLAAPVGVLISYFQLKLRCRIHHIGEGEVENSTWFLQQAEPVWEHERDQLLDMNKAPPSKIQRESNDLKEYIDIYDKWKIEREIRLA